MDALIIATQRTDAHTVRAYACAGPRASLDYARLLAVAASDHASAYSLAAGVAERYLGSFHPIRHHKAPDATGKAPAWLLRGLDTARERMENAGSDELPCPSSVAQRAAALYSARWGFHAAHGRQALRDARKAG